MLRSMTGASPVTTILSTTAWQARGSVYRSDRACPCHVALTSVRLCFDPKENIDVCRYREQMGIVIIRNSYLVQHRRGSVNAYRLHSFQSRSQQPQCASRANICRYTISPYLRVLSSRFWTKHQKDCALLGRRKQGRGAIPACSLSSLAYLGASLVSALS